MAVPPFPLPYTMVEAEAAGWAGLQVECGYCTAAKRVGPIFMPWVRLAQRARRGLPRRLDDVAARLFCATCGRQPSGIALFRRSGDPLKPELLPLPSPPPRPSRRPWLNERDAAKSIVKDRRD